MADFEEYPISDDVRREIDMLAAAARELLELPDRGGEPRTIVGAIDTALRSRGWLNRTGLEADEAAIALGALWGEQVTRAFGWSWVALVEAGGSPEMTTDEDGDDDDDEDEDDDEDDDDDADDDDEDDDDQDDDEGDDEHIGVVTSDRRYLVFPTYFIRAMLEPDADVTALLTFNMIAAGNLPPAESGEYIELGAPELDDEA